MALLAVAVALFFSGAGRASVDASLAARCGRQLRLDQGRLSEVSVTAI